MNLAALLVILVASATGLDRASDPALAAIAERRVVEVQVDFSHAGADPCCAEVIAWNSGQMDSMAHAVNQWQESPRHWTILTNPAYTAIGCAAALAGVRTYAVCVLAAGAPRTPAATAPVPIEQSAPEPAEAEPNSGGGQTNSSRAPSTSVAPPPAPPVEMLPDAAMVAP